MLYNKRQNNIFEMFKIHQCKHKNSGRIRMNYHKNWQEVFYKPTGCPTKHDSSKRLKGRL